MSNGCSQAMHNHKMFVNVRNLAHSNGELLHKLHHTTAHRVQCIDVSVAVYIWVEFFDFDFKQQSTTCWNFQLHIVRRQANLRHVAKEDRAKIKIIALTNEMKTTTASNEWTNWNTAEYIERARTFLLSNSFSQKKKKYTQRVNVAEDLFFLANICIGFLGIVNLHSVRSRARGRAFIVGNANNNFSI